MLTVNEKLNISRNLY